MATYSKETGRLSQLTVNAGKDGKPNITSYMDGAKFLRIEIDRDEDGKIDLWEYFEDSTKTISRVQISTKGDGRPNRTEFYTSNQLVRAEEDTDGDGLTDKWETYANGTLVMVSFDLTKSGKPTTTVDYRK